MSRIWILLIGILAAGTLASGGCRSCSTCHDYDPPVANCECHACGTHRAGSASGGYAEGEYAEGSVPTEENAVEAPENQPSVRGETRQR